MAVLTVDVGRALTLSNRWVSWDVGAVTVDVDNVGGHPCFICKIFRAIFLAQVEPYFIRFYDQPTPHVSLAGLRVNLR